MRTRPIPRAVQFSAAAALGCGLAVAGGPALAAEPPLPDDHFEVIVTAQRREERLQDVPISLTARSGEALDRQMATDMAGLGKVAPSLVMTRSGAFTQPYLRGVGKRSTLGVENSVATYVDGVYLASSISALLDLRGIERVEVLNGPQGTLFGRNATGGVIQIVTRDPQPLTSGEVMLQGGTYGYARGDAYVTGGSDRLAGNLAVSLSRNGGYGTNLFTGEKDRGDVDHSLVARSKWVWRAAEAFKLTFAADYQDIDQDFAHRPLAGYPPISTPRATDIQDVDHDAPDRFRFRYGGVSLRAEADLAGMTFVSLTARRSMRARYGMDLDLGPQPLLSAAPVASQDQVSQEFQLQSAQSATVAWLAGLYYIHIREQYDPTTFDYGGSYAAGLGGRIHQSLQSLGRASSYAAYGQATLPLGAATQLTAGLRYTVEDRSVQASGERTFNAAPFVRPIPGLPLLGQAPLRNAKTFEAATWRASLDHQFSDALMGYASISRGFQSGGWNLQSPQTPVYRPERIDAAEAGLKFSDPAVRISAETSAFFYKYADMQVSAFTPLGSMTTNAASADIYGLDAQVKARPGEATEVTAGAQVLQARYNSFPAATCTDFSPGAATLYAPVSCDATGNRLPFAPRLKLNLAANHRVELGEAGSLIFSGSVAYNSGYFSEPDNVIRQKAFATLDAQVEWRTAGRGPALRLWALNLTDTHYYDVLAIFPTVSVLYRPAAPRRVGASAIFAF